MVSYKKMKRRRRLRIETMTDTEYADYLALTANTPAQIQSLLKSLEKSVRGFDIYIIQIR